MTATATVTAIATAIATAHYYDRTAKSIIPLRVVIRQQASGLGNRARRHSTAGQPRASRQNGHTTGDRASGMTVLVQVRDGVFCDLHLYLYCYCYY